MARQPSEEFIDVPIVRTQLATAAQFVAARQAEEFNEDILARLEYRGSDVPDVPLEFDSPLETTFWLWWMAFRRVDEFCSSEIEMHRHVEVTNGGQRFIVDFSIVPSPTLQRASERVESWPAIGIELDGHAFHEKSLEQVTYRNQRDRALQQAGWRLFHFSFSEFTTHPIESLSEVVEFARATYGELIWGADATHFGKYHPPTWKLDDAS